MSSYDRDALIELVRQEALQTGTFTLASGKTASYYLDCRLVTLHPRGANLIAAGMLDRITALSPAVAAVGGMAIGADPITAAMVTLAGQRGLPLRGFMVRKEPKGHGAGRQVEGPVREGQRVVIVEDVITSGGSALQAADAARRFGLEVVRVLAIIDRLAGGREAFAQAGLELETLLTIRDLGIEPDADG
jgi:orotate phosphoribosyltransferase